MTEPRQTNIIARSLQERLIRAWETETHDGGYRHELVTFPISSIERLKSFGPDHSVLILRSGTNIPVELPYATLERLIYAPDFRDNDLMVLDLRSVTGVACTPPLLGGGTPGNIMSDGSIYLGEQKGKAWYVTSTDAKNANGTNLTMNFNQAAQYAEDLKAHGHCDWIVPDREILEVMYQNKHIGAFSRTFNETGAGDKGWYWSSTQEDILKAYELRFKDGEKIPGNFFNKSDPVSVRCVRCVETPTIAAT